MWLGHWVILACDSLVPLSLLPPTLSAQIHPPPSGSVSISVFLSSSLGLREPLAGMKPSSFFPRIRKEFLLQGPPPSKTTSLPSRSPRPHLRNSPPCSPPSLPKVPQIPDSLTNEPCPIPHPHPRLALETQTLLTKVLGAIPQPQETPQAASCGGEE